MYYLRYRKIVILLIFCFLLGLQTPLEANREFVTPPPVERTKPKVKKIKKKCAAHKAKLNKRRAKKLAKTRYRIQGLEQGNVFVSPWYLTLVFILLGLLLVAGVLWMLGAFFGPALLLTIGMFSTIILGSLGILYAVFVGTYLAVDLAMDSYIAGFAWIFIAALALLIVVGLLWGLAAFFGAFMLAMIAMWLFLGVGIVVLVFGVILLILSM